MKRSRAILVWLLTLAALSCVSAKTFLKLNSTQDLKRIYAEKENPVSAHSLPLLHLLANHVSIDNNTHVYPDFDPTTDYGSDPYENPENLLDRDCKYYTLGNVNKKFNDSKTIPPYVRHPKGLNMPNMNRARILLCLSYNGKRWRIHQVYLTQHYESRSQGTAHDPARTFEISPELLRELQEFSFNDDVAALQRLRDQYNQNIDNSQLNSIINTWGREQAPLGLLILHMNLSRKRMKRCGGPIPSQCEEFDQMHVAVVSGSNGYATIVWRDVYQSWIDKQAAILLFNSNDILQTYIVLESSSGSYETSVSLNDGLQARLKNYGDFGLRLSFIGEYCRSPEFQSPKPVPIRGYDIAKLQLFVRNGYSCFRLYFEKDYTLDRWFPDAWVALYESYRESTDNYNSGQWQWVTYFAEGPDSGKYKTYEYCTGTAVDKGLQARFMIRDYQERARTPIWV
ncbi:hypothetical protein NL108_018696 [Boleophthalmus pectinirostris]|uniref:uncharacterized protein LOC129410344 n=1 Tax=Boleophthalmus pectinirostris TaxID=150288 RepID=UPI00242E1D1C|nr:uncharacterized protein LOC129410344 [Boleophthalmus pectinirostris]KAJ0051305.1 hypothetical protein NL108_018696 [Boleophthalmus pectinirostris]